jgi:glycosyltransferase involved in cell wall biosynthesis
MLGTKTVARTATFPLFFNPLWVIAIIRFLRKCRPDVLVVRDLPLAFLAGFLGRVFRSAVILDMAENYPAALTAYRKAIYTPFLIRNAWLPKQYEKLSLLLSDHVIVVTKEQAQRLHALGVKEGKISIVGNTPEAHPFGSSANAENGSMIQDPTKRLDVLFVGKLDAHRGVELVVRAMPDLLRQFPKLTLTIVGDGRQRAHLQKVALSLGLGSSVRLPGWIEFGKIWSYIESSAICLIPHLRSEHTDTTLPNKLFDYMSMGKPVIASNCAPLERVIRETDCGLTFRSGDVSDLQRALRTLLSSPEMQLTKGQNGKKAVRENYNWNIDRKSLADTIRRVSASFRHA